MGACVRSIYEICTYACERRSARVAHMDIPCVMHVCVFVRERACVRGICDICTHVIYRVECMYVCCVRAFVRAFVTCTHRYTVCDACMCVSYTLTRIHTHTNSHKLWGKKVSRFDFTL